MEVETDTKNKIHTIQHNELLYNSNPTEYVKLLEYIVKEVNKIPKEKHIDLFAIIDKHTNKYSENNNGIFINLSEMDQTIITELYEYITYIKLQEKNINDMEKEKEIYSNILNST